MDAIILDLSHADIPPGPIQGFRFIWAFHVSGYDPRRHCQRCFKGERVAAFCTGSAASGRAVVLDRTDRHPYVYVCGVAAGPKRERGKRNFHLALRYAKGSVVRGETYNGYVVTAQNAEQLEIMPLPEGFGGLPEEHARCKNFQFAVGEFGYPPGG